MKEFTVPEVSLILIWNRPGLKEGGGKTTESD
jgi:hypothetical protein